jgi:hypothetical protein
VRVKTPPRIGALPRRWDPRIRSVAAGTELWRLHSTNPKYPTRSAEFRRFGPLFRFDQHPEGPPRNATVGIMYLGETPDVCLTEVFMEGGTTDPRHGELAYVRTATDLRLLSLLNRDAAFAGTISAICKIESRTTTQAWARYWYASLSDIDGIRYRAAFNDDICIALFDRRARVDEIESLPLRDPSLATTLIEVAEANGLDVLPRSAW